MPLTFAKKLAPATASQASQPNQEPEAQQNNAQQSTAPKLSFGKPKTPAPAVKAQSSAPKNPGATASWMFKGQKAHAAIAAAEAQAEKAKSEAGKLWPFWMPAGSDRTVTFLDGELDSEGMLDVPMYMQHRVKVAGDWESFVCTAETEPCPGCESGDSKPSLVGIMTIIDHTPYTIQKGPNAGKTIEHARKTYIATRQTLKLLAKQAKAIGGLTGATFEISRTGDKEPGVGNSFVFQEKHALAEIAEACGMKPADCVPADYAHEITYRTAAELTELGWGKPIHSIGKEKGVNTAALAKEL